MNARLLHIALDGWPGELIDGKFRQETRGIRRYCTVGWMHEVAMQQGEPCTCGRLPLVIGRTKRIVRCVAASYGLSYEEVHRLMRRNDHCEMWAGDLDRSETMRSALRKVLSRDLVDVQTEADAVVAAMHPAPVKPLIQPPATRRQ